MTALRVCAVFLFVSVVPSPAASAEESPALTENRSCLVDGSWRVVFSDESAFEGAFSAGVYAGGSPAGRKVGDYEVTETGLVFSGGSLGRAPKGEPRCAANTPGTYLALYAPDCWTMRLQSVDDPCEARRAVLEGATWRR